MPQKAGTPIAVVAGAVAGGIVIVALAFYWFVMRDSGAATSAPAADVVEVKGRVLVRTAELQPGDVYIDGVRRGSTTKGEFVVSLPMGQHEVRVMIGEKQICTETAHVVDPAKLSAVVCRGTLVPSLAPDAEPAATPPAADGAAAVAPVAPAAASSGTPAAPL